MSRQKHTAERLALTIRLLPRPMMALVRPSMGRNMFGPVRGPWLTDEWKGWWGPNPPYHHPVFVLTNHSRQPLTMEGGTTFYFVTDGILSALERAMEAANGKDVRIRRRIDCGEAVSACGTHRRTQFGRNPEVAWRGRASF